MVKKILITPQGFELFGKDLHSLFGDGYKVEFVGSQIETKTELISKLKDFDGCIIGSEKIDAEVLDSCPNLKILSRFGIGYNSIDVKEANIRGVVVTIVPDINSLSVVRHCLALMLSLTNNIFEQNDINGGWMRSYNISPEENKIGLIGLGPIGLEFGRICKMLGYEINYYSRNNKYERGFKYISTIDELVRNSNIISLHLKSVPDTKCIIDKKIIDLMEDKYFLNTARGDLVDEKYLYHRLLNGKIIGAGLDVFENEPTHGISTELRKLKNVVSTCHISCYDTFTVKDVGVKSIKNIINFFDGKIHNINKIVKE